MFCCDLLEGNNFICIVKIAFSFSFSLSEIIDNSIIGKFYEQLPKGRHMRSNDVAHRGRPKDHRTLSGSEAAIKSLQREPVILLSTDDVLKVLVG